MNNDHVKLDVDAKRSPRSRSQTDIPISPEDLMGQLDIWKIKYKMFKHAPLRTVEESKTVQHLFLKPEEGGGHIKNLYLRDHKKNNYLIVLEQDREIDLKKLKNIIGASRLSFGSSERLMENLGVYPGAVTPFSMVTGVRNSVSLFIDTHLKFCSKVYAHPLVNNKTLELSIEDLELFFKKISVIPNWIDFSEVE